MGLPYHRVLPRVLPTIPMNSIIFPSSPHQSTKQTNKQKPQISRAKSQWRSRDEANYSTSASRWSAADAMVPRLSSESYRLPHRSSPSRPFAVGTTHQPPRLRVQWFIHPGGSLWAAVCFLLGGCARSTYGCNGNGAAFREECVVVEAKPWRGGSNAPTKKKLM